MIEIYSPVEGKKINIEDVKIKVYNELDENGEPYEMKVVEYVQVGNNRKWKNWLPYEDFIKENPDVQIK